MNDVWSFPHDTSVRQKDGSTKQVKTRQDFTLIEVDNGIATIKVETIVLTPIRDPALEAQLIQHVTDGTVRFDIAAGRVVGQQTDIDKRVIGFQGEASSLHYVTRFTEELLPEGKPTASVAAAAKPKAEEAKAEESPSVEAEKPAADSTAAEKPSDARRQETCRGSPPDRKKPAVVTAPAQEIGAERPTGGSRSPRDQIDDQGTGQEASPQGGRQAEQHRQGEDGQPTADHRRAAAPVECHRRNRARIACPVGTRSIS